MVVAKKKSLSRKNKKVIRRTFAGICLASAVAIACIPPTVNEAYNPTSGLNYSYGVEADDNTPSELSTDRLYTDGVDLGLYKDGKYVTDASPRTDLLSDGNGIYKILKVSTLSNDQYIINWQFKIYLQEVAGSNMGVICQYNSTFSEKNVKINPTMPYKYLIIDDVEYGKFFDSFANQTTENVDVTLKDDSIVSMKNKYSVSYSTTPEVITTSDDEYFMDIYFHDIYERYLAKFPKYEKYLQDAAQYQTDYNAAKTAYNKYLQDYQDWESAGGDLDTKPEFVDNPDNYMTPPDPVAEPKEIVYVNDMSLNSKYSFFCEYNPLYNNSTMSLKGYKLKKVGDYSSGSSGVSIKYVYMPMGKPNTYFKMSSEEIQKLKDAGTYNPDPEAEDNDDMGFRIIEKCLVIAIGENAFRETGNVENLDICGEIKYIGDNAFRESFINTVTFENVKNIGNRAFMKCDRLYSIKLSKSTVNIGTEAFRESVLKQVVFPVSLEYIGPGAFSDCLQLTDLDFSAMQQNAVIDNFAFFNDIKLNTAKFLTLEPYEDDPRQNAVKETCNIAKIGEAAFACIKGVSGKLTEFNFPEHISGPDSIGNFVLAGRANLKKVRMPGDYGKDEEVILPFGVFYNCISLENVEFPAINKSCGYVKYGVYTDGSVTRTMFDTVQNPDFYVRGPELNMRFEIAYPRKSTWGLKTNIGKDVPYIYIDRNGEEQFEISNGMYILIIDDNGTLKSCTLVDDSQERLDAGIEVTIPSKVGETKVTGIDSECFSEEKIHKNITELTIDDDSITEIAPKAFKDCPRLKKVSIGNSVTKIGDSAFENCPNLDYVNFEAPKSGYSSFPKENIGTNAFSTGAKTLTFEGDIEEGYGPFDWAMQYDNYVDENNGVRVCYTSGYPTYLTVLVDNRNKLPTLVDYPHFEQIDVLSKTAGSEHPLSERYAHLGETYTDSDGNDAIYSMTLNEEKLVNSALNLTVPNAIKSIDVRGYMKNESLLDESLEGVHTNTNNVSKYLLSSKYYTQYNQYGLFSGYYGDNTDAEGNAREFPGGNLGEKKSIGNDVIQSIKLPNIEYLPNYCFESCENLTSVVIGDKCKELGACPFKGCYNLASVAIGNPKYKMQNGILYTQLEDGTYELSEVLASRGNLVGNSKIIANDDDPLLKDVSEIADSAMMDCDKVYTVDLRGMDKITKIPDNCFKESDKLGQVIVPSNVTEVGKEAFADGKDGLQVVFYGDEVYLPGDAFKNLENFSVVSYENSSVRKAARAMGADVSQTLDYSYEVKFYKDRELLALVYVTEGSDVSRDDIPADPEKEGYIFKGWDHSLSNVRESFEVFAIFEEDPEYEYTDYGDDDDVISDSTSGSGSKKTSDSTTKKKKTSDTTSKKKKTSDTTSKKKSSKSDSKSDTTSTTTTSSDKPSDDDVDDNKEFYTLTVSNGNGSGSYKAGATVIISCTNAPAGKEFSKWVPETDDLGIASVTVAATTLKMPAHNSAVAATFVDKGTVTSTTTSTTTTAKKDDSGTKVVINKDGISNKNLSSAKVTGSPDDFVIRITETQAATEAVEAALEAEYGSLDNIKYSAMDISLYDSTGNNKITDYSGLSIDITIPIPDILTKYAGNNKVAGVVNDKLDKLNPKFTSIDGVPCITFKATHFSPYTIYVDVASANESTGKIDETPKTGDGIQPKWFLSFGLFALSIALFFMKDKKKIPVATR